MILAQLRTRHGHWYPRLVAPRSGRQDGHPSSYLGMHWLPPASGVSRDARGKECVPRRPRRPRRLFRETHAKAAQKNVFRVLPARLAALAAAPLFLHGERHHTHQAPSSNTPHGQVTAHVCTSVLLSSHMNTNHRSHEQRSSITHTFSTHIPKKPR